MAKTTHTHEHTSQEPKKHGCCGESHAKDEKPPPVQNQANTPSDTKREHPHHSEGGACCCGSDKASK